MYCNREALLMERKSLQEVRDFSEEKFTKRVLFQKGESVVFVLNFMPGQSLPPHKHPGTNVFILVQEGKGIINVDGVETAVSTNDALVCEGEEQFSFSNTGSVPARLYVVINKIPNQKYAQNV